MSIAVFSLKGPNEYLRPLFPSKNDRYSIFYQSAKARLRVQEQHLGKLDWEHEVLRQRFEQTQDERDELYGKFVKAIHEVQQKSNFKNLLLEKKLTALADTLEKKVRFFLIFVITKLLHIYYILQTSLLLLLLFKFFKL